MEVSMIFFNNTRERRNTRDRHNTCPCVLVLSVFPSSPLLTDTPPPHVITLPYTVHPCTKHAMFTLTYSMYSTPCLLLPYLSHSALSHLHMKELRLVCCCDMDAYAAD